jgi:hypothetical protein
MLQIADSTSPAPSKKGSQKAESIEKALSFLYVRQYQVTL